MPVRITNAVGRKFAALLREEAWAAAERRTAARRAFRAGFHRCAHGLTRTWEEWMPDGRTVVWKVTIFATHRGRYAHCIAGPNGPIYSGDCWESEEAALDALAEVCVGVGPCP